MWRGGGHSEADAERRGGSGTAYVECAGATRGLFLQGAETFDGTERRLTELVDDGVSLYDFSHVGLYAGAVLGFAPANVPSDATPAVTVSVGHFVGDRTGRLHARSGVRLVAAAQPANAPFATAQQQTSEGELVAARGGGAVGDAARCARWVSR